MTSRRAAFECFTRRHEITKDLEIVVVLVRVVVIESSTKDDDDHENDNAHTRG